MTKKDFQLFAEALSQITDDEQRTTITAFIAPILKRDNSNFDYGRFVDWIARRIEKRTMKGTKYNPKYMPLGVN